MMIKIIISSIFVLLFIFMFIFMFVFKLVFLKIKLTNDDINKIKRILAISTNHLYYENHYFKKKIFDNYKIKNYCNMLIICQNTKEIKILLPCKIKRNFTIYVKNDSLFNVFISTNNNCYINNLIKIDDSVVLRPSTIIKIMVLEKNIYLITKI